MWQLRIAAFLWLSIIIFFWLKIKLKETKHPTVHSHVKLYWILQVDK